MRLCSCGCGGALSDLPVRARVLWGDGLAYQEIADKLNLGSAGHAHQAVNLPVSEFLSSHTNRANTPRQIVERIGKKTRWNGDCLEWQGAVNNTGYGGINYAGRKWASHRLAYLLAYGHLPTDKYVCHRCDNRRCVNPEHLFLGTHEDNVRDMRDKGRGATTLTAAAVREILPLIGTLTPREIAERYGVSRSTIYAIKDRRAWRDVEAVI